MGMTMIEKILARAAGREQVRAGDTVVCRVDMNILIDLQFTCWVEPLKIADPRRVAIILDHAVPAPTVADADAGVRARAFARTFGIERFFDVGRHGICHQVIAENALALPGQVLTCTDSHTCAGGAYNNAARGLGPAEVIAILCTGRTWYSVAPTIRYDLTGKLAPGVAGRDVVLHIAGRWGDAPNTNLEFGGPGLPSVAMNDRRTIATQAAEISADFATFGCDELCAQFLAAHGAGHYTPADPDPDAAYLHRRTVDLSQLGPYVARPGSLSGDHSVPVGEIESRHVDQCFIGSCANGQLEDLRIAAEILDGRQVAPGTRLIVTPASQAVYRDALRLGYVQKIADSGAVVTNATCGACFGYHMGVVGAGEVCLTASTRNFRGRMGSPDAEIYMASTATVAALRHHRPDHRPEEDIRMTAAPNRHRQRRYTGRAWVFGDSINTDAMYPGFAMKMDIPEAAQHVFYDLRPGWVSEVQQGDIVIAGRNFGIGSSRPVAALMRHLGVTALVAEEFNSLFLRNAINNGLPAVTVPAVRQHVAEGDTVTVDLDGSCLVDGEVRLDFAPLPAFVLDILDAGGLLPRLVADGYLPSEVAGTTT